MSVILSLATCLVLSSTQIFAEESQSRKGHGQISIGYQFIAVDGYESSIGKLPSGKIETQSLNFELEYYLNERWTLSVGLPYVKKRYKGSFRALHDPLQLNPPRPEIANVDRGNWNEDFQDFHLGVRYLAREGWFNVEPYVFIGVPSNDYPFYGWAAIGQNLLKMDVGSQFSWYPGLSDAYYRLDIAYVFVEETLGVSVNHWKVGAEMGYYFSQHWTGRVFGQLKDGKGLSFPDDFPPPLTNELWYQHDRLLKHNYANVGVGLDWTMNENYHLSSSLFTMVWEEQVNVVEYAFAVSLTRSF